MNVTLLSGLTRSAGGIFYAVSDLAVCLHKQRLDICVLGIDDGFFDEDQSAWASLSTLPYAAYGPLAWSAKLPGLLAQTHADVIHLHGLWLYDQWTSLKWQKKTGRPVVISPHGMLDPWAVRNSAWKKKLAGALFANESLHKATCIHALCTSEVASIRSYGLNNSVALIPNGVELPDLEASSCGTDRKQLLFLGRIHPKKGLKELIEAWAWVKKQNHPRFSDWGLMIAGWDDGGYELGLKQLATRLGVNGSIDFVGSKFGEEKDRLLRSVDAFILPSYSEGLPMSVLEAWSYGLPVVMTNQCNLPEGFDAGAAIRIEPAVSSIAEGIMQSLEMTQSNLTDMGANGRKLVEQKFTWDRIALDMKAVYEWCLGGEKPACILESQGLD